MYKLLAVICSLFCAISNNNSVFFRMKFTNKINNYNCIDFFKLNAINCIFKSITEHCQL